MHTISLNILLDSKGHGRIGFSWELPNVEGTRSIFTAKDFTFSKGYQPMSSSVDSVALNWMCTAMELYDFHSLKRWTI